MTESTFGERFCYARWHEERRRPRESDEQFGKALGMSKASVSAWRKAAAPPPDTVVAAIAQRTGVDPGWLAYGHRSAAPEPPDFAVWLAAQRQPAPEAPVASAPKRRGAKADTPRHAPTNPPGARSRKDRGGGSSRSA